MIERAAIGDAMQRLCTIMEQLRSPQGCPWDASQTNLSLQAYLIEEAFEVIEAIQSENRGKLCEELGDLLLQIVFHAQICAEAEEFTLVDVANGITDKLIARHPHVFTVGCETHDGSHEFAWDRIKQQQRRAAGESPALLAGVPSALPALQRAQKVLSKTARYGLPVARLLADGSLLEGWSASSGNIGQMVAGQLLQLALASREAGLDIEQLLRDATRHIEQRFTALEQGLVAEGSKLQDLKEEDWLRLWVAP